MASAPGPGPEAPLIGPATPLRGLRRARRAEGRARGAFGSFGLLWSSQAARGGGFESAPSWLTLGLTGALSAPPPANQAARAGGGAVKDVRVRSGAALLPPPPTWGRWGAGAAPGWAREGRPTNARPLPGLQRNAGGVRRCAARGGGGPCAARALRRPSRRPMDSGSCGGACPARSGEWGLVASDDALHARLRRCLSLLAAWTAALPISCFVYSAGAVRVDVDEAC
eukprot:scaffold6279_cov418-Prasinococcus_capsulatus_cf.AAC.10